MRLSTLESARLLPRFARSPLTQAICAVFDGAVRAIDARCAALPCEASAAALAASRDDELAVLAADLGVVPYYPDLSRRVRERLIMESSAWTRRAATATSAAELVNTIFFTDTASVYDPGSSQGYRYTMTIAGEIVTDALSFRRLTECLRYVGHATTTPTLIETLSAGVPESVYASSGPVVLEYEVTI